MTNPATPPRKRKPIKATAKAMEHYRAAGFNCHVVEKWIPQTKKRVDAFNFGDILAMHPEHGVYLVQATSGSHAANRIHKIAAEPRARVWLASGGKIEVASVKRMKVKRGGKAVRVVVERRPVTVDDLAA